MSHHERLLAVLAFIGNFEAFHLQTRILHQSLHRASPESLHLASRHVATPATNYIES